MTLRTDIIRLAAELPKGDETRRELLAALKTAGPPKILYPAVTDLLIAYGVLQPYTDIDQRLVAKATEKLIQAFQKAAMESDWGYTGPGFLDGFQPTGKELEVYAFVKGTKQTGGGWHSPPEYDDQEDAEGTFESEWVSQPEPLEIKYDIAAPEFLKGLAALGHRVQSPKVQPFAHTMLGHRRAINIIAVGIAKHIAKQVDEQAVVDDAIADEAVQTVRVDYAKDFEGHVVIKNTKYKYGKTQVGRDAIVVPITTLMEVDIEDLEGEADYDAIEYDRYASLRTRMLRRASRLPQGDGTRRKILANLKILKGRG